MSLLLYMIVGLLLAIIQTTLIHGIPVLRGIHDLLLLLVVYAGLFRPFRESILLAVIMGFVMDSLSGGPLGLYVAAYFWICVSIIWLMTFLHVHNRLLLPFVFVAAVMMESLIFLGGSVLLIPDARFPESGLAALILPVVWVVFTGPLFVLSANAIHQRIAAWYGEYLADKRDGLNHVTSV